VIWRTIVLGAYVAVGLVFGLVFGGGWVVIMFFAVWGFVWLGFSQFWAWADNARRALLRRSTSG